MPDELFVSNISTAAPPAVQTEPTALLTPTLDGEESSYFEWLGAGSLEIRETAGAMHQSTRRAPFLSLVQFAFDRERLFVRVDADWPLVDLLADGHEISLKFLQPDALRFSVRQTMGRLTGLFWDRRTESSTTEPAQGRWVERGTGSSAVAAGQVLESACRSATWV